MNIIYRLAFFSLFQLAACMQASEFSPAARLPGNHPKQKTGKAVDATLVLKSADGGQTWQNISEGLPGDKLEGSFFVNNSGFYLRTGNYIYHSKPNNKAPYWEKEIFPDEHSNIAPGKSRIFAYDYHHGAFRQKIIGLGEWSPIYDNFQFKGIIDVFETAGGTVFIVCDRGRGLYRSIDNGKNWKEVHRGVWKLVESNGVLMANSVKGIIRSTDDGETWETVISEGGVGIDVARIDGGFAAITFNTQSDTRRVRTTYDGGKTWQAIDAGLMGNSLIVPGANPLSKIILNDAVWNPTDTGLPEQAFITSIIQVGEKFFCGHPKGIVSSSDKGKTWKLLLPSIEGKVFNLYVSGNVIYAIPTNGGC